MHAVGHDRQVSPADEPAADARPTRVLVVGDANPDLVLSGDVVPRFGQAEQLLDDASLVIGGSAAITAHGLARLGRPGLARRRGRATDHFGAFLTGRLGRRRRRRPPRRGPQRRARPGSPSALNRGDDRAMLTLTGAIDSLTERRRLRRARRPARRRSAPRARRLAVPAAVAGRRPARLPRSSPRAGTDHLARHQRRPRRTLAGRRRPAPASSTSCCPTATRSSPSAATPTRAGCRRTGGARPAGRGQGRPGAAPSRSRRTARRPRCPAGPSTPSTPPAPETPSTRRSSTPGSTTSPLADVPRAGPSRPARCSVGCVGGTAGQPTRDQLTHDRRDPHRSQETAMSSDPAADAPYVREEIARQPDAWARAAATGHRAGRRPAATG